MTIADRIFGPFEKLIAPLDLPVLPMPDDGPLKLVWHFAKMFRAVLIVVGILSIISASVSLLLIWAMAFIVDGVSAQGASLFLDQNWILLLLILITLAVFNPSIRFVAETYMYQTVETLMPAALRWQAHKAVENQDMAFFEDLFAGQVASRIAQVTSASQRIMMLSMSTIPYVGIQFFGSFALLLALSWQLAMPVLFWIIANSILAYYVMPLYMQRSKHVAGARSKATGAMTDIYSNIAMVKLFAAEDSEAGAIRKVIGETIDTQHSENRAYIATDTCVNLLNVALVVSIFSIGIWGLVDGFVTLGEFVAAITVSRSLSDSSNAFIGLGQGITRALGTIKDAMPVITSQPKITDKTKAPSLVVRAGEITFNNVDFSYGDAAKPVLRKLDLQIKAGEKVGIVGLSGAGKSTLIALLLRLRDVDAGSIQIDGQDVRDVTQASLRRQIGVVTQDVSLLHRSIRDNIRYGDPTASDAQIEHAAKLAQADIFIQELTDSDDRQGYDAHVGEKGIKLSGGQRQRVSIARVLLKDAPILALDEATSALDSEAEAAIQKNLTNLMEGKTTIAVAHRLSTIAAMDRLVVMDKGMIVEQGTHDELIESDGLYAQLWARQSGGFLVTNQPATSEV
ncbi:ABC transporter ATP-binding protein [Ahrensia sp. 13_GOM-1096m]|uniref:ABC transporter ATP-binding protein n=1 Tax=Ahrensia sp. 13_GOM-1096m TaxID=1380380 RepID=UPI00047B9F26|nr:ABC transporter ATP-binding protein [Ahrensia sp. 13_GOM-1096m]